MGGETSRLVRRLAGGGELALDELLNHTLDRIRAMVSQMFTGYPVVTRQMQAEDVVQEVSISLVDALRNPQLESSRHYYNLAGRIARHTLIDLAKKFRGPRNHAANHHTDGARRAPCDPGGPLANVADAGTSPSSLEEWTRLHEAVEKLPEELREVFHLRFYEEKSRKETASLLGISEDQVKDRYRFAKALLTYEVRK